LEPQEKQPAKAGMIPALMLPGEAVKYGPFRFHDDQDLFGQRLARSHRLPVFRGFDLEAIP